MEDLPDPRARMLTSRRPWGDFQQFTLNEPTTVKIITVEPGCRLSLQTHDCRAEFWQVLDGPAEVTVGGQTWSAVADEQVWIPRGALHRLGNPGTALVRVLEIAWGDFDEGDIHRIEDDYQR